MLIKKIVRKAYKAMHPVVGEIWCLHRVVEHRSPMPSNRELEVTPAFLSEKIASAKAAGCRFVDLDTLMEAAQHRRKSLLVNISFDDGFKDIYTLAYPILLKHHIPFTIYLTTGMPDGEADLWWLQLEDWAKGDVQLFEKTLRRCYALPANMRDTMHALTQTVPDETLCKKHSLTWEQLKELVDSGLCTVGSHTVTHPALPRIAPEAMADELVRSAQVIEQHLGQRPKHFSYPHGFSNKAIKSLLKETGYHSAAFGYGGALRHGEDFYSLPRKFIIQ